MMYVSYAGDYLPSLLWAVGGILLVIFGGRLGERLSPAGAGGEPVEGAASPSAALATALATMGVYLVACRLTELPQKVATLGVLTFWDLGPEGQELKTTMLNAAISGGLRFAVTLALGLFLTYKATWLAAKFYAKPWLTGKGDPGWGARALGVTLRALGVYLVVAAAIGLVGVLASNAELWGLGWAMSNSFDVLVPYADAWSEKAARMHALAGFMTVVAVGNALSKGMLLALALWLITRADRVAARLVGGGVTAAPAGREES
jgi:hypothetical protein